MFGRQTILSSNYKKVFIKKTRFSKNSQTGLDSNHLINRDLSMITPIKKEKKNKIGLLLLKKRGKEKHAHTRLNGKIEKQDLGMEGGEETLRARARRRRTFCPAVCILLPLCLHKTYNFCIFASLKTTCDKLFFDTNFIV